MTAYCAARVLDGRGEVPLNHGAVVVESGRVVAIGPINEVSRGTDVVDLGDATILPGLMDVHVHLVWSATREPHTILAHESPYLTALRCASNCERHLRAGVTTVRDAGSTDAIAVAVSRAVELGVIKGPRIVAAGRAICMTGGHSAALGCEADGPDAICHSVRREMKGGAHFIKLMASGGIYGHGEEVGSPQLTVDEMRVAVEEAHKAGRKTAAHAYSPEAITNALDAGVDCIEHGSFLNRDLAARMRASGTYIVPTLSVYQAMHDLGPGLGAPDYILRKTTDVMKASRTAFQLALDAGVRIATGTDAGAPGHPHGQIADEVRLMVEYGATPMQAIRFATAASAELLGLEPEVGTLHPGARADLLAVTGDPAYDIRAIERVRLVLRDGVPVSSSDEAACVVRTEA